MKGNLLLLLALVVALIIETRQEKINKTTSYSLTSKLEEEGSSVYLHYCNSSLYWCLGSKEGVAMVYWVIVVVLGW